MVIQLFIQCLLSTAIDNISFHKRLMIIRHIIPLYMKRQYIYRLTEASQQNGESQYKKKRIPQLIKLGSTKVIEFY